MGKHLIDITGSRFGRLIVTGYAGSDAYRHSLWNVKCDCGNTRVVYKDHLTSGSTTSCGCHLVDVMTGSCNPNWHNGASFEPYCPKFNGRKKEEIRKKYNRTCAQCGVGESDNKDRNGKTRRLSVHHVDRDKEQGCNGKRWDLVPLCARCHAKAHNLGDKHEC
jgi:hypothetical protein